MMQPGSASRAVSPRVFLRSLDVPRLCRDGFLSCHRSARRSEGARGAANVILPLHALAGVAR